MSGNRIKNEDNNKKIRSELDSLMKNFDETFADNSVSQNANDIIGKKINEIARPQKTYDFDAEALDKAFKEKASKLVDSMFKFYVDAGIMDRKEYASLKKDLDTSNLANMLYQLKTVKITINILMDEVTGGNTDPKTIAALSDMQNRFTEIIRMQANYVMFLEDTYKKLKYESEMAELEPEKHEQKQLEAARNEAETSEFFLTANPKELIKQITEVSPLTDEEHAQMKEEGQECISGGIGTLNTDPKRKEELMAEKGVDEKLVDKSDEEYGSILDMI